MPKKFKGENSKAVEARLRKNSVIEAAAEKKKQEEDAQYWKDDDKGVMKKQQRKDDKDKKKQETQDKKQQLKELYNEEMLSIKSAPDVPAKVTRAEIELNEKKRAAAAQQEHVTKESSEQPLEENVNQMVVDGEEARDVEQAISILDVNREQLDKHPEKRVKAAYTAFEEENLPRLKEDNQNMRLSQLKQILKKDWQKSPQNPLNQRYTAYNVK